GMDAFLLCFRYIPIIALWEGKSNILFKSPRPAAATLPVSAFLPFSLAMGHGRFPAPADGSFQVLGQL
ncbi:MAG: hypothetical protein ACLRRI_03820, partial [Oscillospiraceae bacterium]